MNNDRIAEVYEGAYGSPETQRIARERIHWMCRQVRGDAVLDVGCSQGIVALLLGREGKRVVGIDREAGAVADAQRRLQAEEQAVAERVRFVHGEGTKLDFPDGTFETVLLGEVIEHQLDPRPVIAEARRVLGPGGALVLSTPYGLFPYPDHKGSIYLEELIQLVGTDYRVETLELLHHYIGLVATPAKKPGPRSELWQRALAIAEQRLATQDLALDRLRDQLQRLRSEPPRAPDDEATAAPAVPEHEELERAQARIVELEAQVELLLEAFEMAEVGVIDTDRQIGALVNAIRVRDRELTSARAEQEALLSAYGAAQRGVALLREHLRASDAQQAERPRADGIDEAAPRSS